MSQDGGDRPEVPMELGLRVDVLDNEGIWNTGQIVDVSRDEEDMVEIKYDGWGDEYNEWIPLSAHRLAPLHMFTMVKKCWAKLNKWPWWPAFVVLRAPTRKTAADALNEESKLYVEFFDSYNEEKRSRCWMQKKNIVSFQEGFDDRASKNIGKNFPVFVEGTQRAMAGGSPVLFSGNGTLPIEFSSRYAEPLAKRKDALVNGDEDKWFKAYRVFSDRYRMLYGFEYTNDPAKKLLAAQRAKGANANSAGEDDDDDEVEIIEDVQEIHAKPAARSRAPTSGKRSAKKQPKQKSDDEQDDIESEEKEEPEYEAVSEGEEDEDDDAADDEEPESPRGRRSSRLTKRRKTAEEETTPTRRSTRARRTKVLEQLVASTRASAAAASVRGEKSSMKPRASALPRHELSLPSQETRRRILHKDNVEIIDIDSSSRSPSPEPRGQRERALDALLESSIHPSKLTLTENKDLHTFQPTVPLPIESAIVSSSPQPRDVQDVVKTVLAGESAPPKLSSSRRKPKNPKALSSPDRLLEEQSAPASKQVQPTETSLFRYWIGLGASEDASIAARKPWSIQSWLLGGLKKKLADEGKIDE